MAGRRVAKTAIEWAAFAERVPPNQVDAYRAFKAKSEMFVSRVHKYPENLPKIDWTAYKNRIAAAPGLVDKFQKAYDAMTVPYPKDKDNIMGKIDEQKKSADVQIEKQVAEMRSFIAEAQKLKGKIDSVPPLEEMTYEMYCDYFPNQARDPVNKPTFWPHTKLDQGGVDPHELKPKSKFLP